MSSVRHKRKLLNRGSILFGIGLAGAFDGIVFHQLLQWHSVASDGLFHAFTVAALAVGAVMLWQAGPPSAVREGRLLLSGALIGAGGFNLVEGIVNHHLLQLHHVRQGHPDELWYDLAFLASGLLLAAAGFLLRSFPGRRKERRAAV